MSDIESSFKLQNFCFSISNTIFNKPKNKTQNIKMFFKIFKLTDIDPAKYPN